MFRSFWKKLTERKKLKKKILVFEIAESQSVPTNTCVDLASHLPVI